jgi:hypothetical protein
MLLPFPLRITCFDLMFLELNCNKPINLTLNKIFSLPFLKGKSLEIVLKINTNNNRFTIYFKMLYLGFKNNI